LAVIPGFPLPQNAPVKTEVFHGKNLRKHRFSGTNRAYLVTTCCLARKPIFADPILGAMVIDELRRSDRANETRTFAFVVMPDHLHWLLELRDRQSLSSVVKRVKGGSAIRINQRRGQSGSIWQPGFYEREVRKEESLESIGDYIIHNPVRAGLVARAEEYPLWDLMWKRSLKAVRD
jgi:REP element-mobilizing transposase RayT